MNILSLVCVAIISVGFGRSMSGQAFIDLGFDQGQIIPDNSPYTLQESVAIPGWTAYGYSYPDILYNTMALDSPSVSLIDQNAIYLPAPLIGPRSIYLFGGDIGLPGPSISQTGLVPLDTVSLRFLVGGNPIATANMKYLLLSLGNQNVPYQVVAVEPRYTVYGANVSAFAGQVEQLTFTGLPLAEWEIDQIQFSTLPVPEPSGLNLLCLGVLWFGRRRKRK